jgi:Na+/glutamate symporter
MRELAFALAIAAATLGVSAAIMSGCPQSSAVAASSK